MCRPGCAPRASTSSPTASCRPTTAGSRWASCWWECRARTATRKETAMCLAVPGRILRIEDRDGTPMSIVDFGGIQKDVCLQYIPDAEVGQYVVVHVGFAIQRLDEESAIRTLAEFQHLGVLKEEFADGFELAAKQAGVANPNGSMQSNGSSEVKS